MGEPKFQRSVNLR